MHQLAYLGVTLAVLASGAAVETGFTPVQSARGSKIADTESVYYAPPYLQRRSGAEAAEASAPVVTSVVAPEVRSDVPGRSEEARNGTARFFNLGQLGTGESGVIRISWQNLVAAGALILAAIIGVPLLIAKLELLFGRKETYASTPYENSGYYGSGHYSRSEDGISLTAMVDRALRKYDIDATACVQRGVCTYVRKAALNVLEGRAESSDLILDGLATNSYITSWLDGTSVMEASNTGRSGADCAATYTGCTLSADMVYRAIMTSIGDKV